MKKKLLLILFLFATIVSFAQVTSKIAPAFRYAMLHPLNKETEANYPTLYKLAITEIVDAKTGLLQNGYSCIIYTKNLAMLRDKGLQVQSVLPNFVTAVASLQQISELSYLEEIKYIATPKTIFPNNDICVGTSGASLLHSGKLNNTAYKGDGVIVGVFDTGIDWDHPDFRNPTDQTKSRILRIWDQTISPITGEVSPTGLNYGVEYTQAHLNNELDGTPTGYVREKDLNGHGTHVTGTAAGNGAALATKKYMGIAPNADIVVVKGGNYSFSENNIINSLTYFQNIANAFGKPIVVNMSIGGQDGAHDGSNAEEIAVDNFSNAANGRVVAIAGGNDNGTSIHKQINIGANAAENIVVNVPTANGNTSTDVFQFTMYANDASNLNVIITTPNNGTVTANAGQNIVQFVLNNTATIYVDNVVDAASGDRMVNVYVARNTTSANPAGTWSIALTNTTANALTIDGWLNYKGANFSSTTISGSDNNYLVGSPGNATTAITVASYMAKLDWYSTSTTAAGGYAYSNAQQDNISNFSSVGPRRDNVLKPNVAANGQAVASCLSSDAGISASSNTIVVQDLYRAIQGTSMATPEVAGCIALLLQAKPTASYSQIKNAIVATATKDNFTTANANAIWGSGKIDVFKAASSLTTCTTFKRVTLSYDSSTTSANNSTQNFASAKVATRFTPTITGKLGGVYFKTGVKVLLSNFNIEVRANDGGVPSTLLGTINVAPASVSKFSWNYYDISSLNIDVSNGVDYFVVLKPSTGDTLTLGFESLSVSGRSLRNNGTSWVAENDLRIRTVVYNNTIPATTSTTNGSICSGGIYSFNGASYATAGTYTATLANSLGCDSIATLHLTIKNNYTITASTGNNGTISFLGNKTVCEGNNITYTFTPNTGYSIANVLVNGVSIGAASSYVFTNVISNHTIAVTFTQNCSPTSSTTNAFICTGSSYVFNGNTYTTQGSYVVHLINVEGCDSAATLNLSVGLPAIAGSAPVCVGANIQLSNGVVGGVWSSLTNRASINATTGLLTGLNAGTANIKYTKMGCSVATNVTINAIPTVPYISYAPGTPNPQYGAGAGGYCANKTFTVVGSPSGGLWSSTGVLVVNSVSGIVNTGAIVGSGSLKYTITSNGCSNSRTITGNVVTCAVRGVNGEQSTIDSRLLANTKFKMYPNPAHTSFTIQCPVLIGNGGIAITDVYGKIVKRQTLSLGSNTINVSALAKGFYMVNFTTIDGNKIEKLIVE